MTTELVLGAAIVTALVLYVLFGGADFGGGVWDLLATRPRREDQRALIERAIGPIWEANHVWLILVVVILFTGFPPAFSALSIAFHVPLTAFLVGIVFRGASFAFRSFDPGGPKQAAGNPGHRARFGLGFSIASVISPVLLGMIVGATASGAITIEGGLVTSGYFAPWLSGFPVACGLFALGLCAYLAATYLTYEAASDGAAALADDFRRRAIVMAAIVAALGGVTLALAFAGAPRFAAALTGRPWAWPIFAAATLCAAGAVMALVRRRYRAARALVAAQVALIVGGWAAGQYPYLVMDDLTVQAAASNARTQRLLVIVLLAGVPVLVPSLYLLFRVFKGGSPTSAPSLRNRPHDFGRDR